MSLILNKLISLFRLYVIENGFTLKNETFKTRVEYIHHEIFVEHLLIKEC